MKLCLAGVLWLGVAASVVARDLQPKPNTPDLAAYEGWLAPQTKSLLVQKGDHLAIIGDSITEQKMYSRLIETYLTACRPDLAVTCRQFGWSGEKAEGFLKRMTNDVLRFKPTVATTCYGMNDFRYVPYADDIAASYRDNQTAIVRALKADGVRVVLGSPGTIASVPHWVKNATGTKEDLNLALSKFRNIDIEIAESEHVAFADVYWPMLLASAEAKQKYGEAFHLSGKDGVHPAWAGHVLMAQAFLTALGLDGEIGTLTLDLKAGKATASEGHQVTGFTGGDLKVTSTRLPICAADGEVSRDDTIRSGMALGGFNERLNRFVLKVVNASAASYAVTWGPETRTYTREQLAKGVNLADDFQVNPFTPAFTKIWEAVGKKQEYETRQIKQVFHSPEGAVDPDAIAAVTEKVRAPLAAAVAASVTPVEHVIHLEAK